MGISKPSHQARKAPTTPDAGVDAPQPPRSGLMVLGPPMRVLHMDPTAQHLLADLARQPKGNPHAKRAEGLLPRSLAEVCTKLFQHLDGQARAKNCAPLEVKERLVGQTHSVDVHGFGIPSPEGPERARVLLRIEAGRERGNQQSK